MFSSLNLIIMIMLIMILTNNLKEWNINNYSIDVSNIWPVLVIAVLYVMCFFSSQYLELI